MLVSKMLWLLITVGAGWLAPRPLRPLALIFTGVIFLGVCSPLSLFLVMALTVGSYYLHRTLENKTLSFAITLIATCSIFFWYKAGTLDPSLIPLGLSYYALRTLHYSIESSAQDFPPHSLKEYLCYQFFLPTLFVGPIHRFPEFISDLSQRKWDSSICSQGLERILVGSAKIKILANYLIAMKGVSWIAAFRESDPALYQYLDCIRYGSSLYCTFSGYSDLAIGFGLILGFRLLENFHFPFLATNIKEFWNRWHISLTQWSKDYLARPLLAYSRSFAFTNITCLLVIGLWHEVSWQYILWGLYHGVGIAFYYLWLRWKKRNGALERLFSFRPMKIFSTFLTLHFVIFSFPFTKETSLENVKKVYKTLLSKCFINF